MSIEIIGTFDKNKLYCAGSFTKLLTTFVSLSFLAEKFDLAKILDDNNFFDEICLTEPAKKFLRIFQKVIGSKFSLHDICSFYTGLPYTFDLAEDELESVDAGSAFKHHHIPTEEMLIQRCEKYITPVFGDKCKFHYSEISIIFLGFLLEQVYSIKMEDLFQQYVLDKFKLSNSQFARSRPANVYTQDLSDLYDYPSIAILDHGYFCYSNGFYTTLNDMQHLIENLLPQTIFQKMVDIKLARGASNRLLNGLTIELRLVGDDLIYGYEGLSFSGCNIWAYSTKLQKGYLTFTNDEEGAYPLIYGKMGYDIFDIVPPYTQAIYDNFIKNYDYNTPQKDIPVAYQGQYQRVKINEKELTDIFEVGKDYIVIRNPEEVRYEVMFYKNHYRVKGKDKVQGVTVGFSQAKSGNRYMMYDGTLYRRIS